MTVIFDPSVIVWTILALVGLVGTTANWHWAWQDYRLIRRRGLNGIRRLQTRSSLQLQSFFVAKMLLYFVVGAAALTRGDHTYDLILHLFTVGGIILGLALMVITSYVLRWNRILLMELMDRYETTGLDH